MKKPDAGHSIMALIIFALLLLLWLTPYRYEHAGARLIRIHRFSGKVDRLSHGGWRPLGTATTKEKRR